MARFIIRVELLGTRSEDDYEGLHKAMADRDFSRYIQAGTGEWYHLPPAEYSYHGNGYVNASAARDAAAAAAATTGFNYRVLATGGDSAWNNLLPY